jgi:hypothetical protein
MRDAFMKFGFRFFYKPESSAWLLQPHRLERAGRASQSPVTDGSDGLELALTS